MDNQQHIIEEIRQQGLLPLFYHDDAEVCVNITKALYDGGIRLIEFVNRGENALSNFKRLLDERKTSMPGLLLGIGTIKRPEHALQFIEAGADFLVSPVFDSGIADVAYLHKVLWIPGCMTPTEIHVAEQAGCRFVKLFPGNVLKPGYVSAIKELFPDMLFMPTGGVELSRENLTEWFSSGVMAVGMGSKLVTKSILENRQYEQLTNTCRDVLALVQSLKINL